MWPYLSLAHNCLSSVLSCKVGWQIVRMVWNVFRRSKFLLLLASVGSPLFPQHRILGGNFNYLSSGVSGIWQLKAVGLSVFLTYVFSSWPATERPKATHVDEWQLYKLISPQCSKLASSFWWVGFSLIIFSFVSKGDLISWPSISNWYPSSFSQAVLCNPASFCHS